MVRAGGGGGRSGAAVRAPRSSAHPGGVGVVVGGGEPFHLPRELPQLFGAPPGEHRVEERLPAVLVLGDGGPAGVGDRQQAGPAVALICRLTVDRSECTLAASALARIGPSASTVCNSRWVADSTSLPAAASSRALDRRTVR